MAKRIKFVAEITEAGCTICGISHTADISEEIAFPKTAVVEGRRTAVRSIRLDDESRSLLSGVKRIVLPEGLHEIGDSCFKELKELEDVDFPSTLRSIGACAFFCCKRLKTVILPERLSLVKYNAFSYIGSSKCHANVYVPAYARLDGEAFSHAHISHAEIESRRIESRAFYGARFRSIALSCFLEEIGESAFSHSNALYLIGKLPDTLEVISDSAFSDAYSSKSKYTTLEIPDWVKVGRKAFGQATGLRRIYTGESTWRSIMTAQWALSGSGIEYVTIPQGTTTIGEGVCSYCKNLKEVYLPISVSKIESNAFLGSGLKSVVIANRYAEVRESALADLGSCVYIDAGESVWRNYLLREGGIRGNGMTHITVPEGVQGLSGRSLYGCYRLRSVSLPNSLCGVGGYAFANCYLLREVKFGPNLRSISEYGFAHCYSLRRVLLPEGMESIDDYAFSSCRSLTELVLPSTICNMGKSCFTGCYSLRRLVLMMEPHLDACPWDCPASVVWYVPDEWVERARNLSRSLAMDKGPERRILPLSALEPDLPGEGDGAAPVSAGFKRVMVELHSNELSEYALLLSFKVKPEHMPELEHSAGPSLLFCRYVLRNMEECEVTPLTQYWNYEVVRCSVYDPELGKDTLALNTWSNLCQQELPLLPPSDPVLMCNANNYYLAVCYIDLPKGVAFDQNKLKLRKYKFQGEVMVDMSGMFYDGVWYPCTLDFSTPDIPAYRSSAYRDKVYTSSKFLIYSGGECMAAGNKASLVEMNLTISDIFDRPLRVSAPDIGSN